MWSDLIAVGRDPSTGGYRRLAWTRSDHDLREWFSAAAGSRGLDVTVDRCGNQWAWWGDPDANPGVVTGSHLDSVPDGGAYDGPLGVIAAFAAVDVLRGNGFAPARPLGIVNFCDEEGARFGIACAGSRLLTGALAPDRALALRDKDGVTMAEALVTAGRSTDIGRDDEALARVGAFVELHVEQGRGLAERESPVAVASAIWPHGRFRAELPGEANHAGTTRLSDRVDPTLAYARLILAARESAQRHGAVATCGKVRIDPNGVNAIPSLVTAWIDSRGPVGDDVRAVVAELTALAESAGGTLTEESWTDATTFDTDLRKRLSHALGEPPVLATGAGHDAGILAAHGIPTGMIFVRNPTGVSHSPAEFAERDDCLAGVTALTTVLADLAGSPA
ncbi:MAG: beta-ureidopropionase / N-carbamoyl-L-amino-acid hydrolase [Pseudonocardiales bacterium]|nr:beta-ureidopropionase / N-carbamoyl-L-amino-acid hydrolase [Pseudonocardiales bacterium]